MLIGIDGNEANVKNRVGSNVYAYQLLWQMYNQNSRVKYKIYLKDKPLDDLPKETEYWQYKVLKPKFLWTQWRLPMELYLTSEKPDLFFTPGHYAPRFCPSPTVISIMDLAFLRYPEQFKKSDRYQLVNWTKYSIQKASHIFTISQFTKKEIIHFYKYPRDKITVTYPGVENIKYQGSKCKYKNYFLYIGTLQPRKNIIRLIEAFKTLNNKLVIVGKKGWLYDDIFNKVKELGLEDKVIFTGFVDEQEKIALLQNAARLLFLIIPAYLKLETMLLFISVIRMMWVRLRSSY